MEVTYLLSKRAPKVRVSRGGGGLCSPLPSPRKFRNQESRNVIFAFSTSYFVSELIQHDSNIAEIFFDLTHTLTFIPA